MTAQSPAPSAFAEITIAAIATSPGPGGIGIIRLSGPRALPLLQKFFQPAKLHSVLRSHRLYYGWIIEPGSRRPLDEVLAVYMAAPATYTREDVVEIHCHGSYLVLREILAALLAEEGVRLALPGEFTKRAFLNGRIDLTRAEAVIDLLAAGTRQGLQLAMTQLQGDLYQRVRTVRDSLVAVRAVVEVAIDFPDEETEIIDPAVLSAKLTREVQQPLDELLAAAGRDRVFREGVAVVILGRPNVGKSSLLNRLLREERAIVTEVPGTTRDTIEEVLNIHGLPVRIIDTAGIRETSETVEEIGIRRSRAKVETADLVLLLLDAATGVAPDDMSLYDSVKDKPLLLVLNKIDLASAQAIAGVAAHFAGRPLVPLSALTGAGLAELEAAIFNEVAGGPPRDPDSACVPNARHAAALVKAREGVAGLLTALADGLAPELVAVEVQTILDHLGEIIGETTAEEVLDLVFERFCLGK